MQSTKYKNNSHKLFIFIFILKFLQKVTELKEQSARSREDLESLRQQIEAQSAQQADADSDSAASQQKQAYRLQNTCLYLLVFLTEVNCQI